MSKKSMAYDAAQYQISQGAVVGLPGVAAAVVAGKFIAFAATRVKSINCNVNIAGTHAAAGYDVYNGTSSIGEFVCGTTAAGSAPTALNPGATLAEGGYLKFVTKADSATLAASLMVEYELTPGAQVTA